MSEFLSSNSLSRRQLLRALATTACGAAAFRQSRSGEAADIDELPPVRTITRGPRHHWFGYYDKREFDPAGRFVLGMEVDFEHRAPRPDDVIRIGMVDLHDNDRWIELGESRAWCWQQGCMLQWLPGSDTKVVWNDREGDRFVCRMLDVKSREQTTIPHPIYALSPDGKTAIAPSFSRLGDTRPGYGYNGIPDPLASELAPEKTGIFRIDLATGRQELILSIARIASLGRPLPGMKGAKHWFNHLLFNPDGTRFVFLHRWQVGRGRETRMITAAPDGSDLRIIDDNGLTSHFNWRDAHHILAFSRQPEDGARFYLFEDRPAGSIRVVGKEVMTADGHCTWIPGSDWILNDTYPDPARRQHPYLFQVSTGRRVALGHFVSPPEYTGEWRCDTHPRISPDGRSVVIDSPAGASGRQLHLIDIRGIVG